MWVKQRAFVLRKKVNYRAVSLGGGRSFEVEYSLYLEIEVKRKIFFKVGFGPCMGLELITQR